MCAESEEQNGCVGTEWVYGYRAVMSVYQFLSLWLCGWLGATAHCQCPASRDLCAGPNIASLGKGQSSQFEVQFLLNLFLFYTVVRLKNHYKNYHNSRTFYILSIYVISICLPKYNNSVLFCSLPSPLCIYHFLR